MRSMLGRCSVMAFVLVREEPGNMPAQSILESLKRGKNGYPNLREKYHRPDHKVSDDDFAAWMRKQLPTRE